MGKTTKIIGRMTKAIGEEGWEGLFASGIILKGQAPRTSVKIKLMELLDVRSN
jgi:hypothetical protein